MLSPKAINAAAANPAMTCCNWHVFVCVFAQRVRMSIATIWLFAVVLSELCGPWQIDVVVAHC